MTAALSREPVIGILYTGGTFGMVRSERGYTPSADLPERADRALAAAGHKDLPRLRWLEHEAGPPVNSSDIQPAFWYRLAAAIQAHAHDCDGFVVVHGTDTLAYTGSALSFLLANLDRPVVVTGARAPLGEDGSDALANLVGSVRAVAAGVTCEVTLAFGGRLLRANRASKRFASRERVFDSPNAPPLARLGSRLEWTDAEPAPTLALPEGAAHDRGVAMLPMFPGVNGDMIRALVKQGAAALILEAYPAGVGPGGDADFVAAVRTAVQSGVIVVAVSQSRHGRITLGRYATSTPLADAGLIGGEDMTREAALAKLHWLLGTGLDSDVLRTHFGQNLRGELSSSG